MFTSVVVTEFGIIVSVVRVQKSLTPVETAIFDKHFPNRASRHIQLHIRSLVNKEATLQGYLQVLQPIVPAIESASTKAQQPSTTPETKAAVKGG